MLAIINCLKRWESQLTGTQFEILTDYKLLTYWKTQRDLFLHQIRWNKTLSQFDADICYIPGISKSTTDALS
jgi:RNase H-like domain found in reverse transcriptase